MKGFILAFMALTSMMLSAQTEADFDVGLTEDNTGVVIMKYTGKSATVHIPATIQGMPVREIAGSLSWEFVAGAFQGNNTITSVVIPAGVTRIGDNAFSGCNKLTLVTIPEGVTEIGECAFMFSGLTAVTLPKSLKILGYAAFRNTKISTITLPEGMKVDGIQDGGAFQECKNLKTIVIPEGTTTISRQMFSSCSALATIELPASIKTIDSFAFAWCTALTSVTIPASVTSVDISYDAFQGCPKMNLASQALLKKLGYTGSFQ